MMNRKNTISLKSLCCLIVATAFIGCASNPKDASNKVDSTDKALQSNMCKGKINNDGLRQLQDFITDPTAFFCNANWRMVRAVEVQMEAYGEAEKATKAKQTREKLENGVISPNANKALQVSLSFDDETKSRIQQRMQGESAASMKAAYSKSQAEVGAAAKEVVIGSASIAVQIKNASESIKRLKGKDSDDFTKAMDTIIVVKTIADVAQTVSLLSSFKDSVDQYNKNNEFIETILGAEAIKDKPNLSGASDLNSMFKPD